MNFYSISFVMYENVEGEFAYANLVADFGFGRHGEMEDSRKKLKWFRLMLFIGCVGGRNLPRVEDEV